jgi:RNA polymerase sigma factor (sigma-70 family)
VEQFNVARVRPLVLSQAKRLFSLFKACSTVNFDDLVQEGMIAALKAHQTYEEGHKASYTTWLTRCIVAKMYDVARSKSAAKNRDDRYRDWKGTEPVVYADAGYDLTESARTIVQTVAETTHPHVPPKRRRRGRPWSMTPSQRLAVRAFLRLHGLSPRQLATRLRAEEPLRLAFGLERVPCYLTIYKTQKVRVKQIREI